MKVIYWHALWYLNILNIFGKIVKTFSFIIIGVGGYKNWKIYQKIGFSYPLPRGYDYWATLWK